MGYALNTELIVLVLLLDLSRCILIYCHLLVFAFALSTVIGADIRVFRGEMDSDDIAATGRAVIRLFVGLWFTGLLVIYMDTGFDPDVLAQRPKLLIKLVCVFALTLNATVLHCICFDILASRSPLTRRNAMTLSICGAFSNSHWLMATFVGSAKILNNFAFNVLFVIYCIVCLLVLFIAILIAPFLQNMLNVQRSNRSTRSASLTPSQLKIIDERVQREPDRYQLDVTL